MNVRELVGSGEKIGLFALPFIVIGVPLNLLYPSVFSVGGPSEAVRAISIAILVAGVVVWAWSVALILTRVPRKRLITGGPYLLVKHPLYTAVALLVLPWMGFVLDTWLGVVIGLAVYVGSRLYSPSEEATLSRAFGGAWDSYRASVKIPWL